MCRGSEQASLKYATFAWELFWAKGNRDPVGSRETTAPLNYLEEFKLGISPRKQLLLEVILSKWPYVYGRANISLPNSCSSYHPMNNLLVLGSPRLLPHSLDQDCIYIPHFTFGGGGGLWTTHVCGSPIHTKLNLVFC